MTPRRGTVCLVGAGPGDAGLITVRGLDLLRAADVIIHDRLAGPALLAQARPDAELIDAGKARGQVALRQEEINDLIVDRARRGLLVVRLKGGDPAVFGRAAEELGACRTAGLPCEIVPGVSSVTAAAAAAGISLTSRGSARSFAVLTGETLQDCGPADVRPLAGADTLVVLMGQAHLARITQELQAAGRPAGTPAVCVERATQFEQRIVRSTLGSLAADVERAGLVAPVVTIIGQVAGQDPAGERSAGALDKRCIVVTRPKLAAKRLLRRLVSAGAVALSCPVVRIEYIDPLPELDQALREAAGLDWIVITSIHAARSLLRRLSACGLDARALARCRVAAIGSASARVLQRGGLRPDLVPPVFTASALAGELAARLRGRGARVLYPHSDLSAGEMAADLRCAGAEVIDIVAYRNCRAHPPAGCRAALDSGVDAVIFHSPSAVRSFLAAGLTAAGAAIACIGPRTAAAARAAGLEVDVVADPHTDEGIIAGLEGFYSRAAATWNSPRNG
jgi:uroporphyrinogen III methyltransferase/synthase